MKTSFKFALNRALELLERRRLTTNTIQTIEGLIEEGMSSAEAEINDIKTTKQNELLRFSKWSFRIFGFTICIIKHNSTS